MAPDLFISYHNRLLEEFISAIKQTFEEKNLIKPLWSINHFLLVFSFSMFPLTEPNCRQTEIVWQLLIEK